MTLVLRYSPAEDVLRSVNDAPGIVGVLMVRDGADDGPWLGTVVVDHGYEPPEADRGELIEFDRDHTDAHQTRIGVVDAAAACVDAVALEYLAHQVLSLVHHAAHLSLPGFDVEQLRAAVDLMGDARDAILRRAEELAA